MNNNKTNAVDKIGLFVAKAIPNTVTYVFVFPALLAYKFIRRYHHELSEWQEIVWFIFGVLATIAMWAVVLTALFN